MSEEKTRLAPDPVPGALAPSKSLTIKPGRLARSQACLNCGTVLQGPFCHYCGQPDKRLLRFFPVLVREFLEDFLELDSRFTRTMKPLLFRPGKLTRDYLDGRRHRYTPPMRLFIFSSMIFFILAALLAGDAIEISDGFDSDGDAVVAPIELDDGAASSVTDEADAQGPAREADEPGETPADEPGAGDKEARIQINDEPWDRETNPVVIPFLPDSINDWINDEIEQSPQKAEEIEQNPNLIVDKVFDILPATMFVLLPLVALLFKFWYLFAKKYYIEHLIHALHNHSFLFVALTITMLINAVIEWKDPEGINPDWQQLSWINTAIYLWIPVYLLISLKTVYRQGWILTLAKYCVIGFSYLLLLSLATGSVALLSFVLL